MRRFALPYPVTADNDFRTWRALRNTYWPALYIIDTEGRIRHYQFGEGGETQSKAAIQDLLSEAASHRMSESSITVPRSNGAELPADLGKIRSSETNLGADKMAGFVSPEGRSCDPQSYSPAKPKLNEWSLSGSRSFEPDAAHLEREGGGITYRIRARDLHLILGPGAEHSSLGYWTPAPAPPVLADRLSMAAIQQ